MTAATVPADRLFWSVIDASGLRAGRIPAGVWPQIEDDLPFEPGEIWAVGAPLDDHRFAVCAIRRDDLDAARDSLLTLTPESVPEFVSLEPARFNFLIGEFEPRSLRRARTRRHLTAAACTLLIGSLIAIGLLRRTHAWDRDATTAKSETQSLLDSLSTGLGWNQTDLALELQQRRGVASVDAVPPADAAEALTSIIARWPTQVPSKPQSISATGAAASISVTVQSDPNTFLTALTPPEGWTLDEPRLAASDQITRVNLELRRAQKGEP